jgi:hypothetical protein
MDISAWFGSTEAFTALSPMLHVGRDRARVDGSNNDTQDVMFYARLALSVTGVVGVFAALYNITIVFRVLVSFGADDESGSK